jgi:Tfp pilus assembly protein PilX
MSASSFHTLSLKSMQQGVALVIALIGLIAMTLAGLALMRSVNTGNVIAGNLAFRHTSLSATDVGVEAAFALVSNLSASAPDAVYPVNCLVGACNYYPTRLISLSPSGVPTEINWSIVPKATLNQSYTVQYVVDRLCDGPTPITDIAIKCMNSTNQTAGSKRAGAVSFSSANQVYYRATIKVTGPRNTRSFVQVIYAI